MKVPSGARIWVVLLLSAVALLLVVNLVAEYRGTQPRKSAARSESAAKPLSRVDKSSAHATDDLSQYNPEVRLDALKALDSRSLPDEDRNPFQFVGGGPAPTAQMVPVGAAPPAPAPPPPPPPPPLKAAGYNELPGGQKEAMVTFNDDLVVVHEGDVIGSKYKVVKITPAMVVVEDGETQKTIELPFPQ